MQKKITVLVFSMGLVMGSVAMADLPVAQVKHDETITTHYGDPNHPVQMVQSHWHHTTGVGEIDIITLKGHEAYAVNPKNPAIQWLNEHTRNDILEHGAPVYSHKEEDLGLSLLYPGYYQLMDFKLNTVVNDPLYLKLKNMFGDRFELVPPKGPGHYVGIRILPPKIAKASRTSSP